MDKPLQACHSIAIDWTLLLRCSKLWFTTQLLQASTPNSSPVPCSLCSSWWCFFSFMFTNTFVRPSQNSWNYNKAIYSKQMTGLDFNWGNRIKEVNIVAHCTLCTLLLHTQTILWISPSCEIQIQCTVIQKDPWKVRASLQKDNETVAGCHWVFF